MGKGEGRVEFGNDSEGRFGIEKNLRAKVGCGQKMERLESVSGLERSLEVDLSLGRTCQGG